MGKIADVVTLKTGYANFVELKSAFEESQENLDRMAMYRPTKAHRAAFERLCRGLYQPNDKKFYLLSGSYGTGKSHLCLMYANFLSRSSGDPDIKGFYDNYAKLDSEKAKTLRNVRKGGQYLVAICDYHSGRRFEDVVLKAVFEACQKMGLDPGVHTEFDEAQRVLDDWEKQAKGKGKKAVRDFYADFGKALDVVSPGMSVDQIRNALKNFDSEAMGKFREAFRECTGGIEFQVQAGNLIPIIRGILRNKAFKDRFKGLAVLFDEFGFTLERGAYEKDVLQGFMETICKTEPNVVFVGCIHKDFKAYADRLSKDDLAVMSARITMVDLLNEGIEEIIGAIVETEKDSEVWKKEIEPKTGVFDQLVPVCHSLNLFPWIDDVKRIRQRVLEDIYGVHPMALACLLRLSSEIGSDARSTFTFFSGEVGGKEGSYAEFIKDADLAVSGGKLNLYTIDRLFAFFRKELSLKNPDLRDRHRQFVNGFHASLDTLRKSLKGEMFKEPSDERVAVLKVILLYQLCNIPTNRENVLFGLYCLTRAEEKAVEHDLKHLTKVGTLFFRKQSETYELAAATDEDVYTLVDRYVSDPSLHPDDLLAVFCEEAGAAKGGDFLESKQYNMYFNEDKRFKIRFARANDLGDTLWDALKTERDNHANKPARSYEGDVVYVLCEDESEIQVAKNAVKGISDSGIVVAVPNAPVPFVDTLLKVKACKHYRRATGDMGTAEAGFVILGNISIGHDRRPLYETNGIFRELPVALQESAFIDRIHGLLEGWFMPRVTRHTPARGLGFKGDFFSEILHELRTDLRYSDYVSHEMLLPHCEDMRDRKAIARIAEGYLKLLFPDLQVTEEEFVDYCVNPAVRLRQQVRDELAKMDPEFKWVTIRSERPDEFQSLHPEERPEQEQEVPVDPLSPERTAIETTVDIAEGQKGVSYPKLFGPYLAGAREIKLVDPYIRYDYQIHNLVNFCECFAPIEGDVHLMLLTSASSTEEEVELSAKLDEVQGSLEQDNIKMTYEFDRSVHDRWVETDTGWRINIGRGLDIFQKPEGRFSLGFVDHTKRACKATTISYHRTAK